MSSYIKIFFLILSISLVLSQEVNKTEGKEKGPEIKESSEKPKIETIHDSNSTAHEKPKDTNNTNYKKQQKRDFKSKIPFNMTIDEMDSMVLCTVVVQTAVRNKKSEFEALQKKLNISNINIVYEKLGTDIFEKCNKKIDIKFVNNFIKNLTYFKDLKWSKELDEIVKLDYDKYNNETDLRLTMDQQILMYKYQRVDELFRQKRADERENIDKENQKLKIGQIDMESIPSSVKLGIFLVILVLLFGGVFYLLKTLEKKPKDKKKNKKKKTQ